MATTTMATAQQATKSAMLATAQQATKLMMIATARGDTMMMTMVMDFVDNDDNDDKGINDAA
jgi:hypothetical protein